MTKIDIIVKNKKLFYFFDKFKEKKEAIQTANDYKKIYKGNKYYIIPFLKDKPTAKKQYALYMSKVIKILR